MLVLCRGCETNVTEGGSVETEIGNFCKKCAIFSIVTCSACNKKVDIVNSIGHSDANFCLDCFEKTHVICSSCYRIAGKNELDNLRAFNEEGESPLCNVCIEAPPPREIHDNGFIPELKFRRDKGEAPIFLGVELEINTSIYPADHAKSFRNFLKAEGVSDIFYFKHDGSVHGGYEIVTHPFTLQYAHEKIRWDRILEWLSKSGATSYETGECGLHVHVSRRELKNIDVAKLKCFFWVCRNTLSKFSKRLDFKFCKIEQFDRKWALMLIGGRYTQEHRYSAVNSSNNKGTIEFRLYRGTLFYPRFIASLQLSDAVVNFAKTHSLMSASSADAWKHFIKFLRKNTRYTLLLEYLTSQKLIEKEV